MIDVVLPLEAWLGIVVKHTLTLRVHVIFSRSLQLYLGCCANTAYAKWPFGWFQIVHLCWLLDFNLRQMTLASLRLLCNSPVDVTAILTGYAADIDLRKTCLRLIDLKNWHWRVSIELCLDCFLDSRSFVLFHSRDKGDVWLLVWCFTQVIVCYICLRKFTGPKPSSRCPIDLYCVVARWITWTHEWAGQLRLDLWPCKFIYALGKR